jgi:hypothetical protein
MKPDPKIGMWCPFWGKGVTFHTEWLSPRSEWAEKVAWRDVERGGFW